MKTELACIPCIMKQAYNTARRATDDLRVQREIINRVSERIKYVDYNETPADECNFLYSIAKEITGNPDPFKKDKDMYNRICLSMKERVLNIIETEEDPLKASVRIAIYGNLIDLGIGLPFDLEKDLGRIMHQTFGADDYTELKEMLSEGRKKILYLGDNAGEIIFDSILVEKLKDFHEIVYVVKNGPIINDATMEDAEFAGITKMVRVIDTGSNGIGVKWSEISEEFRKEYEKADIIISKGQGNFETMTGKRGTIFFLLRAKCESVARELGVSFGDIVIKMQRNE